MWVSLWESLLAYVDSAILGFSRGLKTLKLSLINLLGLPMIRIVGFGILLLGAAWWLRRMTINRVLRLGEE